MCSVDEEWQSLARANRLIHAMKVYCARTGASMGKAKDDVEDWFARNCLSPQVAPYWLCCRVIDRVVRRWAASRGFRLTITSRPLGLTREPEQGSAEPDASFWWRKDTSVDTKEPPDLAVHVILPADGYSYVQARMRLFFESGARLVWLPDPAHRTLMVYRPNFEGRLLRASDTLDGEDVLPGFICQVAELLP
jgi:hypothetical protein